MRRGPRLRIWISVVVAVGAALVALGLTLLLINTVSLRSSADATLRSDDYSAAVVNVERLVVDMETGLRGFVLTGRPLFLAPLRAAQSALPGATAALQRAANRDHAFVGQSNGLVQASRSYVSSYVPAVLHTMTHDPREARSFSATLAGKQLVDGIRGRAATLEHLVSARQGSRQRAAHRSANHAVAEGVVVLVLLTGLTLLLGAILGRLVVGRERAREQSERTSRALQQSILPPTTPAIPGCELAIRFRPAGAGELVGGDFYDVFAVGSDRWAIVLGDVCGKGAEAAAVTAMARWTLRSIAAAPVDAADALRFLNDAMLRQDLDSRFITIAYLLLTVEADRADVSIACAGHPAPILVPEAEAPRTVTADGTLLGVWSDISLRTSTVRLTRGDSLVAYTDGVTDQGPEVEAADPVDALRGHPRGTSAEQLATLIENYADRRNPRQRDDIAILALRFNGERGNREPPAEPPEVADEPMPAHDMARCVG